MNRISSHLYLSFFLLCLSSQFRLIVHANETSDCLKWFQATEPAEWSQRDEHGFVVFKGKIWIIGGQAHEEDFVAKHDVWNSTDGAHWTQVLSSAPWSPRFGHSVLVYNDQIWVMGGRDRDSNFFNDIWCTTDGVHWNRITNSAAWSARSEMASIVHNNSIWILGGGQIEASSYLNDVWRSSDGISWDRISENAPWIPRIGHTVLSYKDNLWVLGGRWEDDNQDKFLSDVWCSKNGKEWIEVTDSPAWNPRSDHASIVFDDKIWIIGGADLYYVFWGGGDYLHVESYGDTFSDVWFSSDGKTWQQATAKSPWSARSGHASVVFNDEIWIAGGMKDDVWSSPDGKNWKQATKIPLWPPMDDHRAFVFKKKIWIIGGNNSNNVWCSDNGTEWEIVNDSAEWPARGCFAATLHKNRIWILGGGYTNSQNDVWSTGDGVSWEMATHSADWVPRRNHTAVSHDGKLWILGGYDDGAFWTDQGGLKNDVWCSEDGTEWELVNEHAGWSPRCGHTSVVFEGKIWVFGGDRQNDVWNSRDGEHWTLITDAAPWLPRNDHVALVFDGKIWVVGGRSIPEGCSNDSVELNDVWSSTNGRDWVRYTSPQIWSARDFHAAVFFNNQLWIIGGDNGRTSLDDVWYCPFKAELE